MKKLIEEVSGEGLEKLLGEKVLLCANYFYHGKLVGVDDEVVMLEEPSIVYETGSWSDPIYKDSQRLPAERWYVRINMIESFGLGK